MAIVGGPHSNVSILNTHLSTSRQHYITNRARHLGGMYLDREHFVGMHVRCAAQGATALEPLTVPAPPPAYDHRKQLLARSTALIAQRWPELQALAESGEKKHNK